MVEGNIEYILRVWKQKPENLEHLSNEFWQAHVKEAYSIPEIGQAIESCSGLDDYSRYRVFDVRHTIGGALAELVTEGRSELKETRTPKGNNGLVHVLAYRE